MKCSENFSVSAILAPFGVRDSGGVDSLAISVVTGEVGNMALRAAGPCCRVGDAHHVEMGDRLSDRVDFVAEPHRCIVVGACGNIVRPAHMGAPQDISHQSSRWREW